MIHVVATIRVKNGCRDKVLAAVKDNLESVRAEEGCIRYDPSLDVDAGLPPQGDIREDVLTIIETWESLAALHAHLAMPHMAAYKEKVKDWVQDVALQVMTPVE